MTENSWTGILMLYGTTNFLPVLLNICGNSEYVVYGNVSPNHTISNINTSNRIFGTASVPGDVVQFVDNLYNIDRLWKAKAHGFLIGGNEPSQILISTRSAAILSWTQGLMINKSGNPVDQKYPIELLLDLNRDARTGDKQRYSAVFAERVAKRLPGKWMSCIAYLGIKSVFILSMRNVSVNMWLVFFDGAFFLLWSTDPRAIDMLESDLGNHAIGNRERFFNAPIQMGANAVLSLHPQFLISKFVKKYDSYTDVANANLLVCQYIARYIWRQIHEYEI